MNSIGKALATLLLLAAVMAYTIYNYAIGRTNDTAFLVYMVILWLPALNILRSLFTDSKNR